LNSASLTLSESPALVWGDPARIQQTLWNLRSNATKSTPRGGWIDVGLAAGEHDVEVTIHDNGLSRESAR
jgi:signal transduction histidine kinase